MKYLRLIAESNFMIFMIFEMKRLRLAMKLQPFALKLRLGGNSTQTQRTTVKMCARNYWIADAFLLLTVEFQCFPSQMKFANFLLACIYVCTFRYGLIHCDK